MTRLGSCPYFLGPVAFWFGEEGVSASSIWAGPMTISGRVKQNRRRLKVPERAKSACAKRVNW